MSLRQILKETMDQLYPIPDRQANVVEKLAATFKSWVGFCNVCGHLAVFEVSSSNLRENVLCARCRSTNRQRQIALVLCEHLSKVLGRRVRHLRDIPQETNLLIYNTESTGAVHEALVLQRGYYFSEYFGPAIAVGALVGTVHHEDLMHLSLASQSVDIMLSSDVFEHVASPYKAHEEVFRVLKRGGRHIFTVPFYQNEFLDEQQALLQEDNTIKYLKDPEYHGDPLRPEGALVFRIFSLQMLVELRKLGFMTKFHKLYSPLYGILGNNGLVFEAIKP